MYTMGDHNDLKEVCDPDVVADEIIAVLAKADLTVYQGKKILEWALVRIEMVPSASFRWKRTIATRQVCG